MGTSRKDPGALFFPAVMSWILVPIMLLLHIWTPGKAEAGTEWPHVATSRDGTPISYEVFGSGEPTLVFVHGWCCDARYWRAQVPCFSKAHRVVVLDLAGHGHSGASREKFTMKAFGEDVRAVAEETGSRSLILIGHSMGGSVIAEAALLMPDLVKGIIGIDTLEKHRVPPDTPGTGQHDSAAGEGFPHGQPGFRGRDVRARI
jgi:pimeloyl-ACP methyl ester carboxylesterase